VKRKYFPSKIIGEKRRVELIFLVFILFLFLPLGGKGRWVVERGLSGMIIGFWLSEGMMLKEVPRPA